MKIDLIVPSPGESITEVQIASWLVENGAFVEKDDEVVEIDSDKATLSINAEASGALTITVEAGETVEVGSVIGSIDTSAKGEPKKEIATADEKPSEKVTEKDPVKEEPKKIEPAKKAIAEEAIDWKVSPLAKKLMEEKNISQTDFVEFFKKYRVAKEDVEYFLENKEVNQKGSEHAKSTLTNHWDGGRESERVTMTSLRKKLSQRLVSVKNETAMLTTFNEVDMKPIMDIRKKYKEQFKETHGVSLGFMSFFTKAVTNALALHPMVNAYIDGDEIVQNHYADIGIAVSAPKGLVVPVIRNAEILSLAEIESQIKEMAGRARKNRITLEEMTGGTFTITNGGVFGSMLSTPIINPPQSAILGMHNIVERPAAIDGKVEIRPIMYIALSYDHRIIDGKDSVGFLVKVKEMLEDPAKLLLGGDSPEQKLLNL